MFSRNLLEWWTCHHGDGFRVYTYVKTDQIVHFIYVLFIVLPFSEGGKQIKCVLKRDTVMNYGNREHDSFL